VFAYNFGIDDYYYVSGWLQQAVAIGHDAGAEYDLFEGNELSGFWGDVFHGTSGLNTAFRNVATGWEPRKTEVTVPVQLEASNRYDNFIGNVLGTPGVQTAYQTSNGTGAAGAIYDPGAGNVEGSVTVASDSLVASTLMRWGNYDVKTGSVRWCGNTSDPGWSTTCGSTSEVPSSLSAYANAVPSCTSLPACFYDSSAPSWWPAGKPWPAVGPDVSNGNIGQCSSGSYGGSLATANSQCAGGSLASAYAAHANSIPAMDCFLNVMGGPPYGSGAALNFGPRACYATSQLSKSKQSSSAPAAPTGLSAVVT